MGGGFIYILTNKHHTTLYVGITSNLYSRSINHREKLFPKSFSAKYNLTKVVYYEVFDSIEDAIKREKQLKAGSRKKKVDLVNTYNPKWHDLFEMISDQEWDGAPLKLPPAK